MMSRCQQGCCFARVNPIRRGNAVVGVSEDVSQSLICRCDTWLAKFICELTCAQVDIHGNVCRELKKMAQTSDCLATKAAENPNSKSNSLKLQIVYFSMLSHCFVV